MFHFADPYWFLLLVPLGIAAWFIYRSRGAPALLFAAGQHLPERRLTWRIALLPVLPALFLAGLLLALVGLARPRTLFERVTRHTEGIAIQMVVDCSGSMEALDFARGDDRTTRLEVVKETFARFITRRLDDLIGLVSFGGYATSRAPLTLDHAALLHVLKGIEVPRAVFDANGNLVNQEETMTAVGDALATACARLESATNVRSRIVVLLSDGESNTGIIQPQDAAKVAKTLGIRIYTIGVGSTGQAPVRVKDRMGREQLVAMQVRLDEDLLRTIAEHTGGRYFNVRDPRGLEKALDDIDKLEKTRIDTTIYNQYNELFPWFLVPALVLVAGASALHLWIRRTVV